jgi:hypothetical protein
MANYRRVAAGPGCWNAWCVVSHCDGEHHVDPAGRCWTQRQGFEYNPHTRQYDRPVRLLP